MNSIKTAILGYGYSARTFHAPFLKTLDAFTLVAASGSRAGELVSNLPELKAYANADVLLGETDAELIIVTTPNHSHFDLAARALQQGRHVIVDKPFVCTSADAKTLIEMAERQGVVLSVFHNRRWDSDFLTVKQLFEEGRLGEVRQFDSHIDRFRPQVRPRWREQPGECTGIWFDLGPHLIDQALQLFGAPRAVSARLVTLRPKASVTDYFHVQLHYPGLEVLLHASPYCAGRPRRFEIQGTLGRFVKYGLDPQEQRLLEGVRPERPDWAAETPEQYGILYREAGQEVCPSLCGGYQQYFDAIAAAIRAGGANPVPPSEALTGVRLLELAERSSVEGRVLPFRDR